MSFLQPIALWGLLLALTPLIIHLLNLLRHRSQPWAATRFLLQARKNSSRISKIKRWLTLLMRMIALACLCFVIARPMIGGNSFFSLSSNSPEMLVLILDRSASMDIGAHSNLKSKRERALEIFDQFVEPWPESKIALVESVYEEPFFLSEIQALKDSNFKDFTGQTDTSSSLTRTLLKTLEWMKKTQVGPAEILLASDMQRSNWGENKSSNQFSRIDKILEQKKDLWTLKIIPLNSKSSYNISLRVNQIARSKETIKPSLTLKQSKSTNPLNSVDIQKSLNGESENLNLKISSNYTKWHTTFNLKKQAEEGWGSIKLNSSFNKSDDHYYFTYGKNSPPQVGVLSLNPVIENVLRSAAQNSDGKIAEPLILENLDNKKNTQRRMVIQQGAISKAVSESLDKFVKQGGTLVLFPSENKNLNNYSFLSWQELEERNEDQAFTIQSWSKEEGVLKNFADGASIGLDYLSVLKRMVPNQGEALAYYGDGKAFLSKFTHGNGLVYAFSTLPLDSWSSLKDGYILVPSIQRIMLESSSVMDSSNDLICGSEETKNIFEYSCIDLPEQKKPALHAGVYKINGKLTAINRPLEELDNEIFTLSDLNSKLPNSPTLQELNESKRSTFKRSEIWTSFLYLCLAFLLAESLLGIPKQSKRKQKKNV
jgi:hypothetical protein